MAVFNEILEGGLNQVVVKRLGMQTGTAVPAVQPEMTMDLTLESDRPEWGWLKGEYRFASRMTAVAPPAGQHAALVLQNNALSGVLAVVERIFGSVAYTATVTRTAPATLLTAVGQRTIDARQPLAGRVTASDYSILTASLPLGGDACQAGAEVREPFILSPGSFLVVYADAAAVGATFSARWRERPVLPGELG